MSTLSSLCIYCPNCDTKLMELETKIFLGMMRTEGFPVTITYNTIWSNLICKECGKEIIFDKKE